MAFYPRKTIVEMFSMFLQFESARLSHWISDSQLRRSIQAGMQEASDGLDSDDFWALRWHRLWAEQSHCLAERHLFAYLQEPSYWAAEQIIKKYSNPQYGLVDCFQLANLHMSTVLKSYQAGQGYRFKSFAGVVFLNCLRDELRRRHQADLSSPWGFLRKIAKKRLVEALTTQGLAAETIQQYVWVWVYFKACYIPQPQGGTQKLPEPDDQFWERVASQYNREQKALGKPITGLLVKQWLQQIEQITRRYLYPAIASLTRATDADTDIELDLPTFQLAPLDQQIAAEEAAIRQQHYAELQTVLRLALQELESDCQEVLRLYYREGLKQKDIEAKTGMDQVKVSRRLKKARRSLLEALMQWSQTEVNIITNPNQVEDSSLALEEWLRVCDWELSRSF
jgi:RNA polymerase sigma factor (sigma-70 family)